MLSKHVRSMCVRTYAVFELCNTDITKYCNYAVYPVMLRLYAATT